MSIAALTKGDDKTNSVIDSIKSALKELGGEMSKEDTWGKRKFAYRHTSRSLTRRYA